MVGWKLLFWKLEIFHDSVPDPWHFSTDRILLFSSVIFKTPTKNFFPFFFFCLLHFEGTFTSFFKDKKSKMSKKRRNQVFLPVFVRGWKGPDPDLYLWLTDPDPDPYQNVTDPDTAFVSENLSVLAGQQCEQSFCLKRLSYMICMLPITAYWYSSRTPSFDILEYLQASNS